MIERSDEDLAALAANIKRNYALGEKARREGLEYYLQVGRDLLKVKALLGHGKWGAWLQEDAPFSDRRARQLIRLAKSVVTTDLEALEEEWRRIQGNDPPEDDDAEPKPPKDQPPKQKPRRPEQAPDDDGPPIPIRPVWVPTAAAVRYMEWLKPRHEDADDVAIVEEALKEKAEREGMPLD
jgi:hypothetical protein